MQNGRSWIQAVKKMDAQSLGSHCHWPTDSYGSCGVSKGQSEAVSGSEISEAISRVHELMNWILTGIEASETFVFLKINDSLNVLPKFGNNFILTIFSE